MTVAACPHCGCNLKPFEPVTLGPLSIDGANGAIKWNGKRVHFTKAERCLILTLTTAANRTVSHDALINSMGSEDSIDPKDILRVLIRRVRIKFQAVDPDFHAIESEWGIGYRWAA